MRSFAWVLLSLSTLVVACGELEESISMSIFVAEYVPDGPDIALQDAEVCQMDTSNCAMTNAFGSATLMLPRDAEIGYTIQKEGYEKVLRVDRTDRRFASSPTVELWRDELAKDWYEALGAPYPPMGTGSVWLNVHPRARGATLDLLDATGKAFYQETIEAPGLELEATTEVGIGGFVEVPPGDFQIELGGWARECTPVLGWPGDADNRIRFPVRAGYITVLSAFCARPY